MSLGIKASCTLLHICRLCIFMLECFVCHAGSGEAIDWAKLGWTSLGTFACAASANALNQVYEIANDARMERTKRRPLPMGRLTRGHALLFAGLAGSAGVYILATQVTLPPSDAECSLSGLLMMSNGLSWDHHILIAYSVCPAEIPCRPKCTTGVQHLQRGARGGEV